MDGKGRALDNIFTERLWRTVKYEEVYLHDYAGPRQARNGTSSKSSIKLVVYGRLSSATLIIFIKKRSPRIRPVEEGSPLSQL
jgi:hypothetical protein